MFADHLLGCGGGPAANAAVTAVKLGFNAAFAGYLGKDVYGESHLRELTNLKVNTDLIVRGDSPTPLSAILVKPDGKRALINYKGDTQPLTGTSIDFNDLTPKAVLFDGHEAEVSLAFLQHHTHKNLPIVLDAGSLHNGTRTLMNKVTYLVTSEKFAMQYADNVNKALSLLAEQAPTVVITLGERGLIWKRGQESGKLSAPPITAIDTTGAGDAFHGAFTAAITTNMEWLEVLRYASAAGALCCTKIGARSGLPSLEEHSTLLNQWTLP